MCRCREVLLEAHSSLRRPTVSLNRMGVEKMNRHVARSTNGSSQAAIFARLWETKNGRLPRTLARHIVKLRFPDRDQARMHELAMKNQAGLITPAELGELDNYIQAGDLLALLQSRARKTLRSAKTATSHHG
jgi:hypothetical protein